MLDNIITILYDVGVICAEISAIAIIGLLTYQILRFIYAELNDIIIRKRCSTGHYYRYNSNTKLKENKK